MLSRETLERYKRMTPSERLELTLRMIEESIPALLEGPRFELLRRQNDERNRRRHCAKPKQVLTDLRSLHTQNWRCSMTLAPAASPIAPGTVSPLGSVATQALP
jgi:hypothetical protein